MDKQEVLQAVLEVFCREASLPPEKLDADTDILDLDLDSVDYMKIMLGVEAHFGFEFRNEDLNLEEYGTVSQFADFVAGRYLSPVDSQHTDTQAPPEERKNETEPGRTAGGEGHD